MTQIYNATGYLNELSPELQTAKTSLARETYNQTTSLAKLGFKKKYPRYRSIDGHWVKSKAELIVDFWLYSHNIVHCYEKKLPIEENMYSDFWIPSGKVYIEYWGGTDSDYLARKAQKQVTYAKYNLNLIELYDKDIENLDNTLQNQLLDFGIIVE